MSHTGKIAEMLPHSQLILYVSYLDEEAVESPSLPSPRGRGSVQPIREGRPFSLLFTEELLVGVENVDGDVLKSDLMTKLTLSQKSVVFYMSAVQAFLKHCGG